MQISFALLAIIITLSSSTFALAEEELCNQFEEDLCSQPLSSGFPKITVTAPDFSQIIFPGELLNYSYTIIVRNPSGRSFQRVISNTNPGLFDPSKVEIGVNGMTFNNEDGVDAVNVTVKLDASFQSTAGGGRQLMNSSKDYQVTTAGLCLSSSLNLVAVSIGLPSGVKNVNQMYVTTTSPEKGRTRRGMSPRNVINTESQRLEFRMLYPETHESVIELNGVTTEGNARVVARIPFNSSHGNKVEVDLKSEDFTP